MVKRWCRWCRGGADADSVELFDHLYISRRNCQYNRFRVYHLTRGSFFRLNGPESRCRCDGPKRIEVTEMVIYRDARKEEGAYRKGGGVPMKPFS